MRALLWASTACLAAAGTLAPAAAMASFYRSAEVRAEAGGVVVDLRDGQTNIGNGSTPQFAHGEKSWPAGSLNSGSFTADSRAAFGSLSASASLDITRAMTSVFYVSPDADVQAVASFRDEWNIGGQPLDTIGRMRITTHFDGTASATAGIGATYANAYGRYDLQVDSLEEFDNVLDSASYYSLPQQSINQTTTLEFDFRYGRPILLNALLFTVVQIDAPTSTWFAGSGQVSFGNTASITKLEVRGADGLFTTNVDLHTLSGGTYPFMTAVPEPGSAVLMLGGLVVAGWVARRRARPTAAR